HHRLRVPGLPPDPDPHRARERGGAARAGRRGRRPRPRRRAPRRGWPRRPRPPLSGPALGRRAAARRGGPRGVPPSAPAPGPRAPRGTLDASPGKRTAALLVDLPRTLSSPLALVTHAAALAAHADRVATLRDGRIVSDEPGDARPG